MGNKQKLFENLGSACMLLVFGGLIAAAILPWYTSNSAACTSAWFTSQCNNGGTVPARGTEVAAIYNASYGLVVASLVVLAVAMIIFALYVFGNRDKRCVPLHLLVFLIIAAAVITFAVGLPMATKNDSQSSSASPFFNSSTGAPGVGWWIALVAGALQLLVFLLLWCAYKSC